MINCTRIQFSRASYFFLDDKLFGIRSNDRFHQCYWHGKTVFGCAFLQAHGAQEDCFSVPTAIVSLDKGSEVSAIMGSSFSEAQINWIHVLSETLAVYRDDIKFRRGRYDQLHANPVFACIVLQWYGVSVLPAIFFPDKRCDASAITTKYSFCQPAMLPVFFFLILCILIGDSDQWLGVRG